MPEGLLVSGVAAGSPAAAAGLRAGDRIVSMQGEPLADLVDYLFFAGDSDLELTVERAGRIFTAAAEQDGAADLGITLSPGQLKVATCRNRCRFCFVDQMPRGFRPTLYVKDDDWRTSFLHGSYVTLTNLTEEDYARIAARCVSPLYVSVHATDDDVRARLLGTERGRGILPALRRLADGGTAFHAQCVIVEGENDGAVLEKTIRDLAALHPRALSLSLVPVGLTASRGGLAEIRPVSREGAQGVIGLAERLQAELLERAGTRFVFAADEFYLRAGRALPPAEAYEDFPQLENGVGLVADFRDAALEAADSGGVPRPGRFLLVTGLALSAHAAQLTSELNSRLGTDLETAAVPNESFGEHVNVTGLLTGADLIRFLPGRTRGRTVLLPDVMFRDGGGVTLDNMTPDAIGRRIGAPVAMVPSEGGAFVRSLLEPEGTSLWRQETPGGSRGRTEAGLKRSERQFLHRPGRAEVSLPPRDE